MDLCLAGDTEVKWKHVFNIELCIAGDNELWVEDNFNLSWSGCRLWASESECFGVMLECVSPFPQLRIGGIISLNLLQSSGSWGYGIPTPARDASTPNSFQSTPCQVYLQSTQKRTVQKTTSFKSCTHLSSTNKTTFYLPGICSKISSQTLVLRQHCELAVCTVRTVRVRRGRLCLYNDRYILCAVMDNLLISRCMLVSSFTDSKSTNLRQGWLSVVGRWICVSVYSSAKEIKSSRDCNCER